MAPKAIRKGEASALDDLQVRYALDRATLAEWLGVDEATLANWDAKALRSPLKVKIKKLAKIMEGLACSMKKTYISTWLTNANYACGGRAPADLLRDGDFETVEGLVYFLQAGEPV